MMESELNPSEHKQWTNFLLYNMIMQTDLKHSMILQNRFIDCTDRLCMEQSLKHIL